MILLELAHEVGVEPRWKASTHGGEYHSACPSCGGRDRFFIQPNKQMQKCFGYYSCRGCGKHGDAIQFCIDFLGLSFPAAAERIGVVLQTEFRPKFLLQGTEPTNFARATFPSKAWLEKAGIFVEWAHRHILCQSSLLDNLEQRGIPLEAVKRYKIGWCPKDYKRNISDWGLYGREKQEIWLPQGIVIPTIEPDGSVARLKVRRDRYKPGDKLPKYVAISGSMNGLNIIGSKTRAIMIVVESELDAYALHHAVGDIAVVIAVGSNIKNPDSVTDHLAQTKKKLLVCHDNDVAGQGMLKKWQGLYSHAQGYPTPVGKDVGDAFKLGLNIREWITSIML